MAHGADWFGTAVGVARMPFLALVPLCLGPGIAAAGTTGAPMAAFPLAMVFAGGLAAQISVNAFNEYVDFKNGLDLRTERTPFSGGSGTLPANPAGAPVALALAWGCCAAVAGIGLYFCLSSGWGIVWAGLLGLAVLLAYSPILVRHPHICLLAPGLGFGPAMVLGAQHALSGHYTVTGLWMAVPPFALASVLLLVNQIPDRLADATVGRDNIPIRYGLRRTTHIATALWLVAAAAALTWAHAQGVLRIMTLSVLPGLGLAALAVYAATHNQDIDFKKVLGMHTAAVLLMLGGVSATMLKAVYFQ